MPAKQSILPEPEKLPLLMKVKMKMKMGTRRLVSTCSPSPLSFSACAGWA